MDFDLTLTLKSRPQEIDNATTLSQAIMDTIVSGLLAPGDRLPSVNNLAADIALHRLTVMKSYEELEIEGWVMKKERVGVFVSENLPVHSSQILSGSPDTKGERPPLAKVSIKTYSPNYHQYNLNDGTPDPRLFPVLPMARAFSTALKEFTSNRCLIYYDVFGHEQLRATLSTYVHRSRGIRNQLENTMVTRGSSMAIYLAIKAVCNPGDHAVMEFPGYDAAQEVFVNEGLQVHRIGVDEFGMVTADLRALVKKQPIKIVYVTPHHHFPTTVTMSAERRLELLQLAAEFGFYILEDDYDFEFQYDRRPIQPIASIDQLNRVIYVGSFSKSMSPALRMGFLLAHADVIQTAGKWRRIIDRQEDSVQDLAFEKLLRTGVIESAIRKASKLYKSRRDHAYQLIREELNDLLLPNWCNGGLAFWTKINRPPSYTEKLIQQLAAEQIALASPTKFESKDGQHTRVGFAFMEPEEFEHAVHVIKRLETRL